MSEQFLYYPQNGQNVCVPLETQTLPFVMQRQGISTWLKLFHNRLQWQRIQWIFCQNPVHLFLKYSVQQYHISPRLCINYQFHHSVEGWHSNSKTRCSFMTHASMGQLINVSKGILEKLNAFHNNSNSIPHNRNHVLFVKNISKEIVSTEPLEPFSSSFESKWVWLKLHGRTQFFFSENQDSTPGINSSAVCRCRFGRKTQWRAFKIIPWL